MNIILGTSGQVGSAIAEHLVKNNQPVKGVIRNPEKAEALVEKGITVAIADYFDLPALEEAVKVKDGDLIFVLTPESGDSDDVLGDTRIILENYRTVIEASSVKALVGLSSIGAQHSEGTGNLLMSYMLEHAFTELPIPQVFIRPAYYFSNWMYYLSIVEEHSILPTFYPPDQKISMISPMDVAAFIAKKIENGIDTSEIIELEGPALYSSNDVAQAFEEVLGHSVDIFHSPRENWEDVLRGTNFTNDAIQNLIAMTQAVVDGKTLPEGKGKNPIQLKTTLIQYFRENIK